jgi:hypothetical protein
MLISAARPVPNDTANSWTNHGLSSLFSTIYAFLRSLQDVGQAVFVVAADYVVAEGSVDDAPLNEFQPGIDVAAHMMRNPGKHPSPLTGIAPRPSEDHQIHPMSFDQIMIPAIPKKPIASDTNLCSKLAN